MARSVDIARADAHRPDKDREGHNLGWPHYDRHGNCLCLCWRCFGSAGCICRSCAGHQHINCKAAHTCREAACEVSKAAGIGSAPSVTLTALPEPTTAQLYAEHSVESYLGLPLRKGA